MAPRQAVKPRETPSIKLDSDGVGLAIATASTTQSVASHRFAGYDSLAVVRPLTRR